MLGPLTRGQRSIMKTETRSLDTDFPKLYQSSFLKLHTTVTWSIWNGRQKGVCQNCIIFSFEKETFFQTMLLAVTVIFLLKNILSTFRFDRPLHHSAPETEGWGASWEREQSVSHVQRDQEALQLQFIRHHHVLFLEPKSFGVLTTIFSV